MSWKPDPLFQHVLIVSAGSIRTGQKIISIWCPVQLAYDSLGVLAMPSADGPSADYLVLFINANWCHFRPRPTKSGMLRSKTIRLNISLSSMTLIHRQYLFFGDPLGSGTFYLQGR